MELNETKLLWVDKYRPTKLKDYVLSNELKQKFQRMIKSKSIQNMTFLGQPGSGKTTLARLLCSEVDAEVLFIPCATEGTLDVLRTKLQEFCNTMTIDGKPKIVILDELDSASSSGDNNFQKGLRTLIEAAQDDTRFICTANYQLKVDALTSRCPIFPLSFDKHDLLMHVKKILDAENVKYTKDALKEFIKVTFGFCPDIRRIINYLQFCSNSGELIVTQEAIVNSAKSDLVAEIVKKTLEAKNILDVRKFYLANKNELGEFVAAGSLLYNFVVDNGIVEDPDGILRLTDLLYQLNVVVDKEPTFFGMLVAIQKWRSK